MPQPNDLSRSLTALDKSSTLVAVIEMSQSSWLASAIVPGVERRPSKKLETSEEVVARAAASLARGGGKGGVVDQPHRGCFEAGRDGFWLAPSRVKPVG